MPISLQCSSCGASYQVKDEMAGKRVQCRCGQSLDVPAAGGDIAGGLAALEPAGWQQPSGTLAAGQSTMASWGRKKSASGTGLAIVELVAASLAIIQGPIAALAFHRTDLLDLLLLNLRDGALVMQIFGAIVFLAAYVLSVTLFLCGVCLLLVSIFRMVGHDPKIAKLNTWVGINGISYSATGLLIITFWIIHAAAMTKNWSDKHTGEVLLACLFLTAPVFFIVVFAIRHARGR